MQQDIHQSMQFAEPHFLPRLFRIYAISPTLKGIHEAHCTQQNMHSIDAHYWASAAADILCKSTHLFGAWISYACTAHVDLPFASCSQHGYMVLKSMGAMSEGWAYQHKSRSVSTKNTFSRVVWQM